MRKWILALITISIVVLGGCTPTPEPAPVETTKAPTMEDVYISALETEFGMVFPSAARASFIELGYGVCNSLDLGASFSEVMTAMFEGGLDPQETGAVLGAAVPAFCPNHTDNLWTFVNRLNSL